MPLEVYILKWRSKFGFDFSKLAKYLVQTPIISSEKQNALSRHNVVKVNSEKD